MRAVWGGVLLVSGMIDGDSSGYPIERIAPKLYLGVQ